VEGQLVHRRMSSQRRARIRAKPRDDVEHAPRQLRLSRDGRELQRRERCQLGRFEHHRGAGRQRWCDLPGSHEKGKVPRDDLPRDADGLVPNPRAESRIGERDGLILRPSSSSARSA
jgi:hypothetical protein